MHLHRRDWFRLGALGLLSGPALAAEPKPPLKITGLKVTPIALPDPPLLAASGCHGPYFLRNVVELETDARDRRHRRDGRRRGEHAGAGAGPGRDRRPRRLRLSRVRSRAAGAVAGRVRRDRDGLPRRLRQGDGPPALRAARRARSATSVEFAAYLFYRYAADHPIDPGRPAPASTRGKGGPRSTPGARSARPRRWPRWPRGSATAGASASSSSRAACSPPTSSSRP